MRAFLAAILLAVMSSCTPAFAGVEPPIADRHGPGGHFLGSRPFAKPARKAVSVKGYKVARKGKTHRKAPEAVYGDFGFSRPLRYIAGRLVCAANVNLALAEKGIRGTGSRLAKSFLRWGREAGPTPGAVAVFHRGRNPQSGHVAIVAKVEGGKVFYWNPGSRGQGWRMVAIPRRPIAYRVASL